MGSAGRRSGLAANHLAGATAYDQELADAVMTDDGCPLPTAYRGYRRASRDVKLRR